MTALSVAQPLVSGLISERIPSMHEFDTARGRGIRRRIWNALTGRPGSLLSLHEAMKGRTLRGRSDYGIQIVPVESIRGTVNRDGEFSIDFDPLRARSRQRWASVAHARQTGVTMPPVDLTRVGDTYFVEDGHHRISVARHFGQEEIEARVTVLDASPAHS